MMVISRTIVLETDDGRRRCFKVLRLDLYSRGEYERRKAMGKEDYVHSLLKQTAPTDWAVLFDRARRIPTVAILSTTPSRSRWSVMRQ